jgi:hypothetical protein
VTRHRRQQAVAAIALMLASCDAAPPSQVGSPNGAADTDAFKEARAYVLANLKNAESARFGPFTHGEGAAVCGLVSARNESGDVIGPRALVYSPDAPPGDRLYIDNKDGDWGNRGILAEIFAQRGCSIGADQAMALAVRKALKEKDRSEERAARALER